MTSITVDPKAAFMLRSAYETPSTDAIAELTAAAGVTVDGVLLKDSQVNTDQINEKTSTAGVTVDGLLIKDRVIGTAAAGASFTDPIGVVQNVQVAVAATDLAAAATKVLIAGAATKTYKILDMLFVKGTNYNADGDRAVTITDGTTTWCVITNTWVEAQATQRWGTAETPFAATEAHNVTASVAGQNIRAVFSGGSTDGTAAGTFTVSITYVRTA